MATFRLPFLGILPLSLRLGTGWNAPQSCLASAQPLFRGSCCVSQVKQPANSHEEEPAQGCALCRDRAPPSRRPSRPAARPVALRSLTKDRGDNAQNSKSRQIIGKNIKQAGKVDVVKRISEEPETGVNEIWHFQYGVTVRNNHLYIQDLNLPVPLCWFRQSPI